MGKERKMNIISANHTKINYHNFVIKSSAVCFIKKAGTGLNTPAIWVSRFHQHNEIN